MTKEPSVEAADIKNPCSEPHQGVGDELVSRSSNLSRAKDAVEKLSRDNSQQDDVPQKSKVCISALDRQTWLVHDLTCPSQFA